MAFLLFLFILTVSNPLLVNFIQGCVCILAMSWYTIEEEVKEGGETSCYLPWVFVCPHSPLVTQNYCFWIGYIQVIIISVGGFSNIVQMSKQILQKRATSSELYIDIEFALREFIHPSIDLNMDIILSLISKLFFIQWSIFLLNLFR